LRKRLKEREIQDSTLASRAAYRPTYAKAHLPDGQASEGAPLPLFADLQKLKDLGAIFPQTIDSRSL
jgi:hypothetical protein